MSPSLLLVAQKPDHLLFNKIAIYPAIFPHNFFPEIDYFGLFRFDFICAKFSLYDIF